MWLVLFIWFGFITTIFFTKTDFKKIYSYSQYIISACILSILITGERSAFLKSALLFLLVFYFIDSAKLFLKKIYLLIFTIIFTTSLFFIFPNVLVKQTEFFKRILIVENPKSFSQRLENIKYFAHYDTAIEIFKNKN